MMFSELFLLSPFYILFVSAEGIAFCIGIEEATQFRIEVYEFLVLKQDKTGMKQEQVFLQKFCKKRCFLFHVATFKERIRNV